MNDEAKALLGSQAASSPARADAAAKLPSRASARTTARLATVQALYQMDLVGTDIAIVISEFKDTHFLAKQDDATAPPPDSLFFSELVKGVVRRQRDIDPQIDASLASGWRLGRLDRTLRAILRAAVFELVERSDVPVKVVINEYVDIAHAFFDGDEPKVVNGVLDRISRNARAHEFPNSEKLGQGEPQSLNQNNDNRESCDNASPDSNPDTKLD